MGPHDTPAAANDSVQCTTDAERKIVSSNGARIARFATRPALVAKRPSRATPGWPATSHSLRNCTSLAAATITYPSAHSNTCDGVTLGCTPPFRFETTPAPRYADAILAIDATPTSSNPMSMC